MSEQKPSRGFWLTVFLLSYLIFSPLTVLLFLVLPIVATQVYPGMPSWGFPFFIGLLIAGWVFALATWRWKRWGVYGLGAYFLIYFVFDLIAGQPLIISFLATLIWLAILFFLIRRRWHYMDTMTVPVMPGGLPTGGAGSVTLYIDDASLRLMATDGKRIRQWAELSLEPGLIQNGAVVKEAEVVAKIKQLFEANKVNTKKVMLGVSGLRCLTRPISLPQLPEAMLEEAVRREAERVLPVPLEQLYISWQAIPAPEGKSQVFLVAIPSKTADDLFRALHQAGLKPSFMSLKPLLLARVVREKVAVIVDVQTADFDLVIVADGVPQPVRSIPFAEAALPWPEKITVIKNELNRTISFYNSNNPEKPLAPNVPIFASGGLAKETELCQALSNELGHPVLPLPSPLECPEGLDPSRYSVNMGLALQPEKGARASAVNLNALPVPYQPQPISPLRILALSAAVIAAGFLVFLVILVQSLSADVASLRTKLTVTQVNLQRLTAERQKLTAMVAELEKQVAEVKAAGESFTAALGVLEKQHARLNGDLDIATGGLPNTVSLTSLSHAEGRLTINGWAPGIRGWVPSTRRVLAYLLALDSSGRFGDIAIPSMTSANTTGTEGEVIEDEGMAFTLLPEQEPPSKWTGSLETAIGGLPNSLRITSITTTIDGTLTMEGWTPSEDSLLSYLRGLVATGKFLEIHITRMVRVEHGGINFSVVLGLASADEIQSAQKVLPSLELGDSAAEDMADIRFAQKVFQYLELGDSAVEEIIDWENLKLGDTDAGALYRATPDDEAKAVFRKAFIFDMFSLTQFGTLVSKARYSDWRVQARDPGRITVAAIAPNGKTLLVYISVKDGKRVVSGWEERFF